MPWSPSPLRTLVATVVTAAVLVLTVGAASPSAAESPSEVTLELDIDGVYVAPERTDIDEASLVEPIKQARARGLRLVVTAPADPQPDAEAFARRILEASDADASIVFPADGAVEINVISDFEAASFRALAAARSKSEPAAAVEAFTEELLVEPTRSFPPIIRRLTLGVILLAVVLAVAVAVEQALRRTIRPVRVVPPPEIDHYERVEAGRSSSPGSAGA
ncbi:MAG: hypothetical protein ACFCVK_06760 [Acidimicrobiales bacterium]